MMKNRGFGRSKVLPGASWRQVGSKRAARGKKGYKKPFHGTPLAACRRPSRAPSWPQVKTMCARIVSKVAGNGILNKGSSKE